MIKEPTVTTDETRIGRFNYFEDTIIINRITGLSSIANDDDDEGNVKTNKLNHKQQSVRSLWVKEYDDDDDDEEDENIRYLLEGHLELNEKMWNDIAKELDLDVEYLKRRWKKLQRGEEDDKTKIEGKKQGRFDDDDDDDDDDAIIRENVKGFSDIDDEIWEYIAKELNRDKYSVKRRWNKLQREKELLLIDEKIWDDLAKELNRDKLFIKLRWEKLKREEETKKKKKTEKKEGRFDGDEDTMIRSRIEGYNQAT